MFDVNQATEEEIHALMKELRKTDLQGRRRVNFRCKFFDKKEDKETIIKEQAAEGFVLWAEAENCIGEYTPAKTFYTTGLAFYRIDPLFDMPKPGE